VIWPLAQPDEGAPPARLLGPILIVAGLAVTIAVRLNHPYDARHPQATSVAYDLDQDARKAWRISQAPGLNDWVRAVLSADGSAVARRDLGGGKVESAPAPYLERPAPELTLSRRPDERLVLHVTPPPGA